MKRCCSSRDAVRTSSRTRSTAQHRARPYSSPPAVGWGIWGCRRCRDRASSSLWAAQGGPSPCIPVQLSRMRASQRRRGGEPIQAKKPTRLTRGWPQPFIQCHFELLDLHHAARKSNGWPASDSTGAARPRLAPATRELLPCSRRRPPAQQSPMSPAHPQLPPPPHPAPRDWTASRGSTVRFPCLRDRLSSAHGLSPALLRWNRSTSNSIKHMMSTHAIPARFLLTGTSLGLAMSSPGWQARDRAEFSPP